jgi:hypothetical protein
MRIDTVEFFHRLGAEMNEHPERFQSLGEAYMDAVIAMHRSAGDAFAVRIVFDGIRCEHVVECDADSPSDFTLAGPMAKWEAMFQDIVANGRATGMQTINSLALMGDDIRCLGQDPMGLDKFSRFNQTLQEYFDGASHVGAGVA